jgi:hypothetical protein
MYSQLAWNSAVDPHGTSDVGSDVPVNECVSTQFGQIWTYDLWLCMGRGLNLEVFGYSYGQGT